MNAHNDCLLSICRLCGSARALLKDRNSTPKEQFTTEILRALNVFIEEDVTGIHPPYLCKACELKLRRWKANHAKRRKAICNIQVVEFTTSECERCSTVESISLKDHHSKASQFPLMVWRGEDRIRVYKLDSEGNQIVFFTIFANFSWQLVVSGITCEVDHPLRQAFPEHLSEEDTFVLCSKISGAYVCPGNAEFNELVCFKSGPEGQIPLKITDSDVFINGTIRHKKCLLLVDSATRCSVCKIHRGDLSSAMSRLKRKQPRSGSATSNAPNTSLSRQQLQEKVVDLQAERKTLLRRNAAFETKITTMIEEESVALSPQQNNGMEATFKSCDEVSKTHLQEDSPAKLLWEQQKKSAASGKQMRWHPAIIRWCIAMQSKSTSAYDLMRQSGFLRLPHPSTLHGYTHFADPTTGFNAAMLKRVVDDNKISGTPEEENNVVLLFDEMKIKSGLVYSVRSGQIVGFTDVADISNEVSRFERRCRGEEESQIATHVLVVMVRGISSNLHSPVAVYPTTGVTSDQLYPCLWECINFIETAGMAVRALVSDGASSNRKFYRLHDSSCNRTTSQSCPKYSTKNHADPSRQIFFICDVPHLIKTTRNNFENSGYNNCTRKLFYNKQDIKWSHLLELYEWDIGLKRSSPGLRKLHKMTYEHLHLSPTLRMRVYLAAQVLSSTVANAMESYGRVGTSSTVKFIRMFDQFFDCLNVSNLHQGARTRKPALAPYKSPNDWRFDWLLKDFLGFLSEWEKEVSELPNVENAVRKKMCLSSETVEGLRITVYSFVELAKVLLTTTGIHFLLSEKLNQDPLEEYFSKQRGAGGACENPTVEQFTHNVLSLHVASASVRASKRGNVRNKERQEDGDILDPTPLPKRK